MAHQQIGVKEQVVNDTQLERQPIPVLKSRVTPIEPVDPLSFYIFAHEWFPGQRFFWSDPGREFILVGAGHAFTIDTGRRDNTEEIKERWEQLRRRTVFAGSIDHVGTGPILFGGFSFDPYKPQTPLWQQFKTASFIVPYILLTKTKEACYLTITHAIQKGQPDQQTEDLNYIVDRLIYRARCLLPDVNDHPAQIEIRAQDERPWLESVGQAIARIKEGTVQKVVLARSVEALFSSPLPSELVIKRLLRDQAASYVFAMEMGPTCFIGATPERLIKKVKNNIFSACLAGSIRRGATAEEDRLLSQTLLGDPKNRYEHQLVVDMVREVLEGASIMIHLPDEPSIYKTRQVQHLYTPVQGETDSEINLIDLVEALHPTPALGGYPQAESVQLIRELEEMDRGWYAAPIGWLNHNGDGEFVVAIRSALIAPDKATLFAGCGIVADSDPLSELEETQLKLRPMLAALGGEIS